MKATPEFPLKKLKSIKSIKETIINYVAHIEINEIILYEFF